MVTEINRKFLRHLQNRMEEKDTKEEFNSKHKNDILLTLFIAFENIGGNENISRLARNR